MNVRSVIALAACLLVAGCDFTERQAQEDLRATMKDPDSAKFGRFQTKANKACLEANAKNAFGGYTGTQTAFLKRDDKGKWSGWTDPSGQLDWDYCIKDLDKPEP